MENDSDSGTGLYCFFNANNACSPLCMAYLSVPPVGDDYQGQQWARCMVLTNLHRVGKHTVVLASLAGTMAKQLKGSREDQLRANQTPPRTRTMI